MNKEDFLRAKEKGLCIQRKNIHTCVYEDYPHCYSFYEIYRIKPYPIRYRRYKSILRGWTRIHIEHEDSNAIANGLERDPTFLEWVDLEWITP